MSGIAETFNENAKKYSAYRPGYPLSIRDEIVKETGLGKNCRILEIGSGTGQATGFFQSLNPIQTCLEPGDNLIAACRARFPGYEFVCSRYEDYEVAPSTFNLIYAATAFHWLERDTRYEKSASLLKPNSNLVVMTDRHVKNLDGFFEEVNEIYDRLAPNIYSPFHQAEPGLEERNPLTVVYESETERELSYTSDEYIGLLHTFSGHIALGKERLARLCSSIHDLIEHAYKGKIEKTMTTYLTIYKNT